MPNLYFASPRLLAGASSGKLLQPPGASANSRLIGTGPFRLTLFTAELVRLESHDHYHLRHPLLKAVEYWITPPLFYQDLGTSCRHPVQIAIGKPEELHRAKPGQQRDQLRFLLSHAAAKVARLHPAGRRVAWSPLSTAPACYKRLDVDENLITAKSMHYCQAGLIPHWQVPDEVQTTGKP